MLILRIISKKVFRHPEAILNQILPVVIKAFGYRNFGIIKLINDAVYSKILKRRHAIFVRNQSCFPAATIFDLHIRKSHIIIKGEAAVFNVSHISQSAPLI